ncbi:hypothetical protein ABOD99_01400 [Mycoplasmoides gallisepticum]|uniref:hypothetical protein n=1 Tax=Mycoplasmoides gallisepticum TaxID=2096 RepID=UPI003305D153
MKKITKYLLWSIGSISASATLAGLTYYLLNRKKDSMYKIPVKDVSNLEKINVLSNELSKKQAEILNNHLYSDEKMTIFYNRKIPKNIESHYYIVNLYKISLFQKNSIEKEMFKLFTFSDLSKIPIVIFDNYLYTFSFNENMKKESFINDIKSYLSKNLDDKNNFFTIKNFGGITINDIANMNIKIYVALKELGLKNILNEFDFLNKLNYLKNYLLKWIRETKDESEIKRSLEFVLKIKLILNDKSLNSEEEKYLSEIENEILKEIESVENLSVSQLEFIWEFLKIFKFYDFKTKEDIVVIIKNKYSNIFNNILNKMEPRYIFMFYTFLKKNSILLIMRIKECFLKKYLEKINVFLWLRFFIAYSYTLFKESDISLVEKSIDNYLDFILNKNDMFWDLNKLINLFFILKIKIENNLLFNKKDIIRNVLLNNLKQDKNIFNILLNVANLFLLKKIDSNLEIEVSQSLIREIEKIINRNDIIEDIKFLILFKDLATFLDVEVNWKELSKKFNFINKYNFLFNIVSEEKDVLLNDIDNLFDLYSLIINN